MDKKQRKRILKLELVGIEQALNGDIALAVISLATIQAIQLGIMESEIINGTGKTEPLGLIQ